MRQSFRRGERGPRTWDYQSGRGGSDARSRHLAQKKTRAVFDVWKSGKLFQYVIAVCAESEEKGCPIFPGVTTRLSWPFPDPSRATGTEPERLEKVRAIRDNIRAKVEHWCEEMRG
jgi:arsenate reductase